MSDKSTSLVIAFCTRLFKPLCFEVNLFLLTISFFTRIPVPSSMFYSEELLNKANRYFSLVGLFIGCLLALSYAMSTILFSNEIAVLLTMVISLLLTGAFHEDGLADMADGIGGAFNVEKRLIIMKDSRIGTYGAVTLVMALLLKYSLLIELANTSHYHLFVALVLGATLSRALAGSLISSLPYVRDEQSSKSKPLAEFQSRKEWFILMTIAALPLLLIPISISLTLVIVLIVFQVFFSRWLIAKLGGFTGDCLGAAQQLSELLIYLILLAFYVNPNGVSS